MAHCPTICPMNEPSIAINQSINNLFKHESPRSFKSLFKIQTYEIELKFAMKLKLKLTQFYLSEVDGRPYRFYPNYKASEDRIRICKLIFAEGGKLEYPEKNPRSTGKNQQTQFTCDARSGD